MKRRKTGPGRVQKKLAEMLRDLGFIIEDDGFAISEGHWRIYRIQEDCARWNTIYMKVGTAEIFDECGNKQVFPYADYPVSAVCYDTMSECIRYGFTVDYHSRDFTGQLEINANSPRNKLPAVGQLEAENIVGIYAAAKDGE